jgi:hypothetical protein
VQVCPNSIETSPYDLKTLRSVYSPMGFPVEIETNSPDVLEAANIAWARYPQLTESSPVRIRIEVTDPADAVPRSFDPAGTTFDAEWMYIRPGERSENYARANLAEGWAAVTVSAESAANSDYLNYYFLEPLAYLLLAPTHFAFAHASCVALNGRAVVLCGDAAAGKTCLAFACARRGWTYVSGDATHFLNRPGEFTVAGRPFSIRFRPTARDLFPELQAWPTVLRPNGRACIEAETTKLGVPTALRATASHVVFLERKPGGMARTEPVSPDEAARRLDGSVFFGDEHIQRNQRETLHRFATLPAIRLIYSDFAGAESVLRELVAGNV